MEGKTFQDNIRVHEKNLDDLEQDIKHIEESVQEIYKMQEDRERTISLFENVALNYKSKEKKIKEEIDNLQAGRGFPRIDEIEAKIKELTDEDAVNTRMQVKMTYLKSKKLVNTSEDDVQGSMQKVEEKTKKLKIILDTLSCMTRLMNEVNDIKKHVSEELGDNEKGIHTLKHIVNIFRETVDGAKWGCNNLIKKVEIHEELILDINTHILCEPPVEGVSNVPEVEVQLMKDTLSYIEKAKAEDIEKLKNLDKFLDLMFSGIHKSVLCAKKYFQSLVDITDMENLQRRVMQYDTIVVNNMKEEVQEILRTVKNVLTVFGVDTSAVD